MPETLNKGKLLFYIQIGSEGNRSEVDQLVVKCWELGGHPLVILRTAIENRPFIVDLPIKGGDFPVRYVSLPEAMSVLNSLTLGWDEATPPLDKRRPHLSL